jgi:hypothetical protein
MQSTDPKQEQDPMTTATMTATPQTLIANHTRYVSFENSNSWLKRHDEQGTRVIQAGYRENPTDSAHSDDDNPIVISGNQKRWYGAMACQGIHVRSFERSKIETARHSFAACLRPEDNGHDLTVIASHWNKNEFSLLEQALKGQYRVIRNGREIRCTVTHVQPILEGMGSYHAVTDRLNPGQTFLLEIGFGTAEEWVIDENGRVIDGRPVTQLGILNLVNSIAADPTVKATLGNGDSSLTVNLSAISAALQKPTLGRIGEANWTAIKRKHSHEFYQSLKGYLRSTYGQQLQSMDNVVLTGGGAALLASLVPDLAEFFTIPDRPQTASVRGAYAYALTLAG